MKVGTKECVKDWTISLTSHPNKVMLKIFHAKFQHYASQELPFGKGRELAFGKGRETRDQIANIHHRER